MVRKYRKNGEALNPTKILIKNGARVHRIDHPGEFIRDLEWLNTQVQKSVFKRIQGQPIILLTKTAYGYDRRESILPEDITTPKYDKLKTQILSRESYKPRTPIILNNNEKNLITKVTKFHS